MKEGQHSRIMCRECNPQDLLPHLENLSIPENNAYQVSKKSWALVNVYNTVNDVVT